MRLLDFVDAIERELEMKAVRIYVQMQKGWGLPVRPMHLCYSGSLAIAPRHAWKAELRTSLPGFETIAANREVISRQRRPLLPLGDVRKLVRSKASGTRIANAQWINLQKQATFSVKTCLGPIRAEPDHVEPVLIEI